MPARGVSGVTLKEFFSAVLKGLGVPVTANNLSKLGAVARLEGHGGDYNPFNYILGPGTNFNSVGVKNYPDVNTGIAQTIKLLSQRNTANMRASLASDGPYQGWLDATSRFYQSWGGPPLRTSLNNATVKLNEQVDGAPVPAAQRASLGAGAASAGGASAASAGGSDWGAVKQWQDTERAAFTNYLKTQTAEQQAKTIADLKQAHAGGLQAWSEYLPTSSTEVQRYVKFLAGYGDSQRGLQDTELGMLGAQSAAPDPGAPAVDPAASQELTNLLQTFGVSYPNAPQPTPALLAFLRGVGLNLSTAEDVKRRAIERIGASTSDAMADIDRTAGRTKQNVTADLVRRGILQSGEANTRYARHEEDVAESRSDVQRTSAQASETAEDTYRSARDAARQQALDRVINAEQDQATAAASSKAQEDAYKRQQEAADVAWQRQQQAQREALAAQTEAINRYAQQGVVV